MTPWLICVVSRPDCAQNAADNLGRQRSGRAIVVEVGEARGHRALRQLGETVECAVATPGQARNVGLDLARQVDPDASVIFLDDDDWYASDYCDRQTAALRDCGETWICKQRAFVEDDGVLYHVNDPWPAGPAGGGLGGTVAVRSAREALPFSDAPVGEDGLWCADMIAVGRRGRRVDPFGYCYRTGGTSGTTLGAIIALGGGAAKRVGAFDAAVVEGRSPVTGDAVDAPLTPLDALASWTSEQAKRGRGPLGERLA